ncbi:MAG: hypothetical protein KDB53_04995, partial [Planctomycetes bacterium]|nr:hypothetical protein [Planctomycetota bacterium]
MALAILGLSCAGTDPASPEPRGAAEGAGATAGMTASGISQELARERRRRIVGDLAYELFFALDGQRQVLDGRCILTFDLNDVSRDLVLDFRGKGVSGLEVNGSELAPEFVANHIVIPAAVLAEGRNRIALGFQVGSGAAGEGIIRVEDGDDGAVYLYTLNVPADGHAVFPCFDQPDLKARFRLEVEAPAEWTVVANAPLESSADAEGRLRHRFSETMPISTYLFAFAAGPFKPFEDGRGQDAMRFYVRASQHQLANRHAGEVLRLHRLAKDYLARYFGTPYPFQKFDFVCVPDFPFSGMEHPGCIFYGEAPMLFRSEATRLQEARRYDLIAHETAHQWFGDLVTMPWFDDVWLKEGFATLMAHKTLAATFPGFDHERAFFLRNFPSALDVDTTAGATPIRQALANLADAKSNYGPIIYRKGPAVLRALEHEIGEAAFQTGVRQFLSAHAFGVGDWPRFQAQFERAAGRTSGSLDAFTKSWIESAGAPVLRVDINGSSGLELVQEDPAGQKRLWPVSTRVTALMPDGTRQTWDVRSQKPRVTIAPRPSPPPVAAYANDGSKAYVAVSLDEVSRSQIESILENESDGFLRILLLEGVWSEVQSARFDPALYGRLALTVLDRETDEHTVALIHGRLDDCLNRYLLGREDRERLGARIEERLGHTMMNPDAPRGLRLMSMRALGNLAATSAGRALLTGLVDQTIRPPDLDVSVRDRWGLLTRLTLLGAPGIDQRVLALTQADPGDEAKRQAFLVECARPDAATKRAL